MKKVLVLFGGMSPEHDVSILSGLCILKNIDREKYEVTGSYIDKGGNFYLYTDENYDLKLEEHLSNLKRIENILDFVKDFDVVFPIIHGTTGEDGKIQGFLDILNISYTGAKVLGSALAMDKVYAKMILDKAGIKQAESRYIKVINNKYIYVDDKLNEKEIEKEKLLEKIIKELSLPVFVKPSNSGSSIGISKANNKKKLLKAIDIAKEYDSKILVEKALEAREIECGVLGNESVIASKVGEVISNDDFYDYDSKYKSSKSETIINPKLENGIEDKIREIAIKAYKALDLKGFARVDFFLDKENNVFLGEINTIPGFTNISMYKMLFSASGIEIKELITKIIELA